MSGAAAGIVVSILLIFTFSSLFHLIFGGSPGRMVLYMFMSAIGFAVGHYVGKWLSIDAMKLGVIYLLSASVGAWLMMIFGKWIIGNEPQFMNDEVNNSQ